MPGLFGDLPPPAVPKPPEEIDDAVDEREQKRQRRDEPPEPPLDLPPPPAAPPAEAPEAEAPPPAAPAPAPADPDRNQDQVAAALRRIRSHIANPKKFPKASELLRQLLAGRDGAALDPHAHGPAVFSALAASMAAPAAANDPALAREYSKLFTAGSKCPQLFSAPQRAQLDVCGIRAVLLNQMLTTDDSFAFSKAANAVKAAIEELPPLEAPEQEAEEAAALAARPQGDAEGCTEAWDEVAATAHRREALMECVAAGRECYGRAWARTAVDLLVAAAAAAAGRAPRFLPAQRQAIADMVQFVRDQKAARKLGPSGKEAARDQTQFERTTAEWARSGISAHGKVGGGGDHKPEAWLG